MSEITDPAAAAADITDELKLISTRLVHVTESIDNLRVSLVAPNGTEVPSDPGAADVPAAGIGYGEASPHPPHNVTAPQRSTPPIGPDPIGVSASTPGFAGAAFGGSQVAGFASTPTRFASGPAQVGSSPAQFGSIPAQVSSSPAHVGPTPAQFGPVAAPFGSAAASFGPAPAPFGPEPYGSAAFGSPFVPSPMPSAQTALPRRIPRTPLRERITAAVERGLVGKVLALAGVSITLIGVVLLLVLAAQAGLLRPEIRVAGGALLAAALFSTGVIIGRAPEKRPGAAALVATGIATALFDVLAATTIYHWIPVVPALALIAAISGGGFVVAGRWDSQTLAVTVAVGLTVFAPVLCRGVNLTLVVFLLGYAAAALAVQLGRDWPVLYIVNTIATAAPLAVIASLGDRDDAPEFTAAIIVCFTLALVSAIALIRTSSHPLVLALVSMIPLVPLYGGSSILRPGTGASVLGGFALVLLGLAIATATVRTVRPDVATAWLVGGVVTGQLALGIAAGANGNLLGVFAASLVLALIAPHAVALTAALRILATIGAGLGLLALAGPAVNQLLLANGLEVVDRVTLVVATTLAIAVVGVLARLWLRPEDRAHDQRVVLSAGLLLLALANVLCVGAAALITDGSTGGFRAGHMFATIFSVAVGATTLLQARRLAGAPRTLTMTAGLAVVTVAVIKLFLFDLSTLDGVFRVIAFIVVGLVLLSLGVAYAQHLTGHNPAGPNPSGQGLYGQNPTGLGFAAPGHDQRGASGSATTLDDDTAPIPGQPLAH